MAFAAVPAIFLVDGVKVATLQNGGCAAVSVVSGDHLIAEKWFSIPFLFGPTFAKPVALRTTWAPGQTYYYRLETQLYVAGIDVIKWRISALDPQAGAAEVAGRACQTPH
jgi:hypothetical protein